MVGRTPHIVRRYVGALGVLALVAASCTGAASSEAPTTTNPPATTVPSTSTTAATTTSTPSTTEAPIVPITVEGDLGEDMERILGAALTTLRDIRADGPVLAEVSEHHGGSVPLDDAYLADVTTAELADGSRVGAAVLDSGDIVLLADEGDGWSVVGTHLVSVGAEPFFGTSPRRVLVLGSDARPGQNPLVFRMDSIHILTAAPSEASGAILGYPRDAWIDSPYGPMRINALTSSGRGPDAIFEHFTETWGLPLEGYIVTGFAGFEDLVAATLGRITLTIPIPIPTQEWFAGFSPGEQTLTPTRTLDFARTRKLIPGGDFTRSFHQGIVMLAALTMIQRGSVLDVPALLAELTEHTATNLTAADLIQLGAAAMELDIGTIANEVLPGSLGRTSGGASVVFLTDGYESIVEDVLDDGLLNDSAQP
jgi:LCP family protein required for cell wall assembly